MDSLIGVTNPKTLRIALTELATGLEAYNRAYDDAMERIKNQGKHQDKLAKEVLSWLTCAKRPLTSTELQHALAVEFDHSQLDKDNFTQIEDVIPACVGLVTVNAESKVVRLVHYTTQEYLERTQADWFPNAKYTITKVCVTYLSYSIFESGFCRTDDDFEKRKRLNQFYDYAAHN